MRRRRFTGADAVVIAGLLALNLLVAGGGTGSPSGVEILTRDGQQRVALGAGTVRVQGPLGETVVEVGPDGARVVRSPCPLQICVRSGSVDRPGQVVACLPNRVGVRVLGGEGVDAVGR